MKDFIEFLFFFGGTILFWGKITSVLCGAGLLAWFAYKVHKTVHGARVLRGYSCPQ